MAAHPRLFRPAVPALLLCALVAAATPASLAAAPGETGPRPASAPGTRLGMSGTRFTLNGRPLFLCGLSYYGALGATQETARRDLDDLQRYNFNWIRVWATWAAFGNNVAAVDSEGNPREPFLEKLKGLVAECDRRGVVVDVTLSRGNGVAGAPGLRTLATHRRAVETIVRALKPWPNWYLDLANERNIRDDRYASFEDLKALRGRVRELDPGRLVTASHGGDINREELRDYLLTAEVDFFCPHRARGPGSPGGTAARTKEYLGWAGEAGRPVPVHYQEPFRRGYEAWQPKAEDFAADARAARNAGAAGWCFHNGGTRNAPDGRPRRSFDLRDGPLFQQLDAEERRGDRFDGGGDFHGR